MQLGGQLLVPHQPGRATRRHGWPFRFHAFRLHRRLPSSPGPAHRVCHESCSQAAVAALVIGGGGFAVIRAAGDTAAPASQQTGAQGAQAGPADGQGGPGAIGGGGTGRGASGLAGVMYGDFVASDGSGGTVTRRLQSGTVTAVSATSITARSADGHGTTFAVTSSTTVGNGAIGDVKEGDTVTVVGTLSGGTATAIAITDSALGRPGGGSRAVSRVARRPRAESRAAGQTAASALVHKERAHWMRSRATSGRSPKTSAARA